MTATTTERNTKKLGSSSEPEVLSLPVAAATSILKGTIVCDNGSGYATPGVTSTTLIVVGIADESVDNSGGAAGALSVPVRRGCFRLENSSAGDAIAIAERFDECWLVDNQTVAKTNGGATRVRAGIIFDVDAYGVWVLCGAALFYDLATLSAAVSSHTTHIVNAGASTSVSLYDLREVDANGDVGNLAAVGGLLASDSTPILRGDAAESQEVSWATGNTDLVAFTMALPSDFDGTGDAELELVVSSGTTDAATFTVESGWDGGALVSDTADDAATKSATAHTISATIANADIATGAERLTVILTPAAHATDTVQVHSIRLKYTRKYLT